MPKNINAMSHSRRLLLAAIVILVLGLFSAFSIAGILFLRGLMDNRSVPSDRPAISRRSIEEVELSLGENWRISGLKSPYIDITTGLVASDGKVCILVHEGGGVAPYRIIVLDSSTGNRLWESEKLPHVHSLVADSQKLVIAVNWNIVAYDLSSGNLLWKSEKLPDHTRYRLLPSISQNVILYSIDDTQIKWENVLRYYDKASGNLMKIDRLASEPNTFLIWRTPAVDYWTNNQNKIWSTSRMTSLTVWEAPIEGPFNHWPIIVYRDKLIISTGIFPTARAIDKADGIPLWDYEHELVSNLILHGDMIYGIRTDASLISIDPETGDQIGQVSMTPRGTEFGSRTTAYWVAAFDDMVYTYYGDSRELIAFRQSR